MGQAAGSAGLPSVRVQSHAGPADSSTGPPVQQRYRRLRRSSGVYLTHGADTRSGFTLERVALGSASGHMCYHPWGLESTTQNSPGSPLRSHDRPSKSQTWEIPDQWQVKSPQHLKPGWIRRRSIPISRLRQPARHVRHMTASAASRPAVTGTPR